MLGPRSPKHENYSYHCRADGHAGAEKLNDVHDAIEPEARALRDAVKPEQTGQDRAYPNHNRKLFAINHSASFRTLKLSVLIARVWSVFRLRGERYLRGTGFLRAAHAMREEKSRR